MNSPDHPVIRNMETTGTPDGKAEKYPHCPICGNECETIYRRVISESGCVGSYVGCDVCREAKDAWKVDECFPESEDE